MRIVIYCDMEGVSGIQCWEQTGGASPLYEEGRRLYTAEVNAAVRGCLAGGASSVVAQDGHGGAYTGGKPFVNWMPELLQGGAEYVRGYRWARYVGPLEAGECDAVALLGAHARAGAPEAVLCHTVNADGWHSVKVNGRDVGESEILAAIAGSFGVPVICVAGDEAACAELHAAVGDGLVVVPVKRGFGRYAARIVPPCDARRRIEEGFARAVSSPERRPAPLTYATPVTVTVEMASPDRAEPYANLPGVKLIGPRTIEAEGETFWQAWSRLWRPS